MHRAGWAQVLLGLLLLWGSFAGPALSRLTPVAVLGVSSLGLAEDDDDGPAEDDDDGPAEDDDNGRAEYDDYDDDDERPREREPRERERPQPQLFRSLQQELHLGTIWVVQQGNRQQALRVGLEYQGRTIAAITLNPNTGQPAPYESRNTSIPTRPLTQAQLQTYLNTLRTQIANISFSAFGLPSAGAVQFPVFWNGLLVAYVRFNPAHGQVLPDTHSANEILASPLKLR